MGINYRDSNVVLHSNYILSYITEYDIFRRYCSNFTKLGAKFRSELRKDNSPTVSIIEWNGRLLYKDFGNLEHTFNCFSYVAYKYGTDFTGALNIVYNDFSSVLSGPNSVLGGRFPHTMGGESSRKKSEIKIRVRNWENIDRDFWIRYCISKKILSKFAVLPIDYYWIGEYRFKADTITYAFKFHNGFKLYRPYDPIHKWFSNVDNKVVQGYDQLPSFGENIFITSSLKDVMCLEVLNFPSIAFQSEMQMPPEEILREIQNRFNRIFLLYDNDYTSEVNPGQSMAKKIIEKYPEFINICIPSQLESKDISDLIKNKGLEVGKLFLQQQCEAHIKPTLKLKNE